MRLVTNHASNTYAALAVAGRALGCEVRALEEFPSADELARWDPVGALVFLYGWPERAEEAVDLFRGLDVPVATWQVDDPHYLRSPRLRDVTLRTARRSSVYFSHTLELADEYRALGVTVRYLPTAARQLPGTEALVQPPPPDEACELDYSFVCTASTARRAWFEALERKLPGLRGRLVTGISQADAFRVYRDSRVSLFVGTNGGTPDSSGLSERSWEVPFVGGFLLQEERNHLRDHFTPGEDAATYSNLEDCAAKIEHYCRNPDERRAIAARAQRVVLERHRLEHRLLVVLKALQEASS